MNTFYCLDSVILTDSQLFSMDDWHPFSTLTPISSFKPRALWHPPYKGMFIRLQMKVLCAQWYREHSIGPGHTDGRLQCCTSEFSRYTSLYINSVYPSSLASLFLFTVITLLRIMPTSTSTYRTRLNLCILLRYVLWYHKIAEEQCCALCKWNTGPFHLLSQKCEKW